MKLKVTFTLMAMMMGLSFVSFAQNPWLRTSPVKMGYGIQTWKVDPVFNNFRYEQVDDVANSGPLDVSSNNTVTYTKIPLAFESIGENIYCSADATGAFYFLQDLGGYEYIGDDDTEAQRLELLPLELGFGGWIKDRVGLFAGAQYMFSRMIFTDDDVPDELILGGNQRGFHAMAFVNLDRFLLQSTFKYDWVRNSGRASKGDAQTIDLEVHYALGKRRVAGLWAGVELRSILSTGPTGKPTEDWDNDGIQNVGVENYSYTLPDISANTSYFRGGIYLLLWQMSSYDWENR